jgi:serine/threonine protein kinase
MALLCKCNNPHSFTLIDFSSYNAPEVFLQDLYGLEPAKLHKCDIWAYGLLVWEIFAEGQKYFKNEWQRDSDYGVQSVTSNSSQNNYGVQSIDSDSTQDSNTKSQQNSALEYLESDNQQVKKQGLSPATCIVESVFGAFDQKHLRDLGRTFIKGLYFPYGTIEKAYLLKLIDNTLQVDPELRLSRITRLPVMVHWK